MGSLYFANSVSNNEFATLAALLSFIGNCLFFEAVAFLGTFAEVDKSSFFLAFLSPFVYNRPWETNMFHPSFLLSFAFFTPAVTCN